MTEDLLPTAPPVDAWEPWTPAEVAARLDGVDVPWCVVGGWALDLWAGRQQRPHQDLEIAVPADAFARVQERLADCTLYVPVDGVLEAFDGSADQRRRSHQTWVCREGRWRLDVMQEPCDRGPVGAVWVCRRDERLRVPYAEVIGVGQDGIPHLRPELVLLFKARALRDKDADDFRRTAPALAADVREQLAHWIARVHGPAHPWVDALRTA